MRWLIPAALAAVLAVLGTWVAIDRPGNEAAPEIRSEHPVTVPEYARTVTVSQTMPSPSAHARRLSAMLEGGTMPEEPMMAQVLTDSDCTPDNMMISRCRNEVRLADGRTMVLRHPHDMRKVPCLAPGETVLLVPAST